MNRFDPEVRGRIVRLIVGLLAVVTVSGLIGVSVGRPFASSGASTQPTLPATGATARPTASATPRPTETPVSPPSPTSPPPSPTPDDGWLMRSRETFDRPSTWPAQAETGWASGYTDGRYWLRLSGQQTISYRVPLDSAEFRITVDVQVENGYAGLVFLANDVGALYRYQLDSAGRYRLGRRQGSNMAALIDWTASSALKRGPDAVNQIEVRRVENQLVLYANQTQLTTFPLPKDQQFTAQVGMTLDALARDRVAEAFFDNLVVRVPAVPSGS